MLFLLIPFFFNFYISPCCELDESSSSCDLISWSHDNFSLEEFQGLPGFKRYGGDYPAIWESLHH